MMFKRKPRLLKGLQISEISAVDRAAAPGARIMLRKRNGDRAALKTKFDQATARLAASVHSIINDPAVEDKNTMLGKSFVQYLDHLNSLTGTRTPLNDAVALHRIFGIAKNDNERSEPDLSDSDAGMPDRRRRRRPDDEAARLASQMDTDADHDRDDDDDEEQRKEKNNMQTRGQEMRKLAGLSPIEFCKKISTDNDAYDLSEEQVCSVVQCVAKQYARPGESEGSAFLRLLSGSDDVAKACNTALAIAKHQQWQSRTTTMSKAAGSSSHYLAGDANYFTGSGAPGRATLRPRVTGGAAAQAVNNPRSALSEIQALVDELRAQNKTLSASGAFAQVYEDPANADLVRREREENRPTSAAWGG
jgi:hypothetical protein